MNFKEIFAKAENEAGTLTYEEFEKLLEGTDAKFVDLSEGKYVSQAKYDDAQAKAKSKYDDMMSKHKEELSLRDTRINELDSTLTQRNTDLEDLQAKLADAGQDEAKLAELNEQLTSLKSQYDENQAKYAKEIESYQGKLSKQAYEFAVKDYARGQQFSSKAARNDFVSQMLAKNLQMEEGKILGADDFTEMYRKDNEDAFKQVEPEPKPEPTPEPKPTPEPEPKPQFVGSTPGAGEGNENKNQFRFNFTGVRKHD